MSAGKGSETIGRKSMPKIAFLETQTMTTLFPRSSNESKTKEYTKSWVNGAMDNGSKLLISSKCRWLERNKLISPIVNLHG